MSAIVPMTWKCAATGSPPRATEPLFIRQARYKRSPDAAQHEAISAFTRVFDALWRSGATLIRGLSKLGVCNDPGSAAHRFASLHGALRPGKDTTTPAI